jgi:hypothetical protein
MNELKSISREDLLLKLTKIRAENSSLKVQAGKDKSYIEELEHDNAILRDKKTLDSDSRILELNKQLDVCRQTNRKQKNVIHHLNEKINKPIKEYLKSIEKPDFSNMGKARFPDNLCKEVALKRIGYYEGAVDTWKYLQEVI